MAIFFPSPNQVHDEIGNIAIEVLGRGTGASPTTIRINGNLDIVGGLTAVQTTTVDDNNIVLNAVDSPTDANADGGGLTLKGATDKLIAWTNSTDAWHFNQGINITSGNLGIGTTTPAKALDVVGDINLSGGLSFDGAAVVALSIIDDDTMGTASATALASSESIKAYVDAQDLDFQGDAGGALSIDLDSEVLTLEGGSGVTTTGSGNKVSIATDVAQGHVTSVGTLTSLDTAGAVSATGSAAGTPAFTFVGDTDTGMYRPSADTIRFATAGSHAATIDSSGNVGINTTSPAKTLEVKAGSSGNGINLISHANANAVVQLESGSTGGYVQIHNSSNDQKVRIDSGGSSWFYGGSVGIGNDSPTKTLDVTGTFKVSGATTLNGIAYTWPASDGSSGQQLSTDGNGALTWAAQGGGGGGMSSFTLSDGSNTSAITDGNTLTVTSGAGILSTVGTDEVTLDSVLRLETVTISSASVVDKSGSSNKDLYLVTISSAGGGLKLPRCGTGATQVASGRQVVVKNTSTSNSMTLEALTSTIDSSSSQITVDAQGSILLVSDGTNYHIL